MHIRFLAIALLVAVSAACASNEIVPQVIISYNSPANHVNFEIRIHNFGQDSIGETRAIDTSAAGTFNVTVPPIPSYGTYTYTRSVPCTGTEPVSLAVDVDSNNSITAPPPNGENEVNGLNRTGICNVNPPEFSVDGNYSPQDPYYPGQPFNATITTHNTGLGSMGPSVSRGYSVDGSFEYNVSAIQPGGQDSTTFEATCPQWSQWIQGIGASNDIYTQVEQHDEWVNGGGFGQINCTEFPFPSSPLFKPDLVINSYQVLSSDNWDGDSSDYTIQLEVRNIGLGAAGPSNTSVDGEAFGIHEMVNTTALGPNASMFFNVSLTCVDSRQPLHVMADALEQVLETNGTNNHAVFYVQPCYKEQAYMYSNFWSDQGPEIVGVPFNTSVYTYNAAQFDVPSAISGPSTTRITFGDDYVNIPVPALHAGTSHEANVTFTCPAPGAFPMRTIADNYLRANWGNGYANDNTAYVLCVAPDDNRPDLVIEGPWMQGTYLNGTHLYYNVSVYTRNQGLSNASPSTTRVMQDGAVIEEIAIPELEPYYWGSWQSIGVQCMSHNSTLNVTADVYNVVNESFEDNNNGSLFIPACPLGLPDLTVGVVLNNSANITNSTGTYYQALVTTRNIGNDTAQNFQVDVSYGNTGYPSGYGMWQLLPGESFTFGMVLQQLGRTDNRSLDVYVDRMHQIAESDESNNYAHLVVPTIPSPDLAVTSVGTAYRNWFAGRPYNVTVFASNIGEQNSMATDISGRVMANGITYSGFQSGIPALLPGRAANRSGMLSCPGQGDYQLVGLVDSWGNNQESNEENNQMAITIHCIDIVVRINNSYAVPCTSITHPGGKGGVIGIGISKDVQDAAAAKCAEIGSQDIGTIKPDAGDNGAIEIDIGDLGTIGNARIGIGNAGDVIGIGDVIPEINDTNGTDSTIVGSDIVVGGDEEIGNTATDVQNSATDEQIGNDDATNAQAGNEIGNDAVIGTAGGDISNIAANATINETENETAVIPADLQTGSMKDAKAGAIPGKKTAK